MVIDIDEPMPEPLVRFLLEQAEYRREQLVIALRAFEGRLRDRARFREQAHDYGAASELTIAANELAALVKQHDA